MTFAKGLGEQRTSGSIRVRAPHVNGHVLTPRSLPGGRLGTVVPRAARPGRLRFAPSLPNWRSLGLNVGVFWL